MRKRISLLLSLGLLAGVTLSGSESHAASTWNIGANQLFIEDYLLDQGVAPALSGGIVTGLGLPAIQSILLKTASTGHIGEYREILQLRYLEPTQLSQANYAYIDSVIQTYANYNVSLILSFTAPLPAWMTVGACPPVNGQASQCNTVAWMPPDAPPDIPTSLASNNPAALLGQNEWGQLETNMASSISRYINHLWNNTTIPHAWLQSRFILEPYDEFDAVPSNLDGRTIYGTPYRAAQLQIAISKLIPVSIQMTMPSIGGVNAGMLYPGVTTANAMGQWIQDYYLKYKGWGMPNAHVTYAPFTTAAGVIAAVQGHLATMLPYIPQAQQGHFYLTEAGAPQQSQSCPQGMPSSERNNLYAGMAQNSGIGGSSQVAAITFWNLIDVDDFDPAPSAGCDAVYGLMTSNGSGWRTAGQNLINYLNNP